VVICCKKKFMKKLVFLKALEKILEKKKITEKDSLSNLGFDSLKILELMVFNDKNFKKTNISPDQISICKKVNDLVKLYKKDIN
jgi:acyl carrier protein